MIPMFSVSSRNKDKEMFMTGSQEVVGSNPVFSSLESHLQIELTNDNYQELAMAAYELAMLLIETN
jgi:hypothetical protein